VTDEQGQDPGPPPDVFITDINGYPVEVRRVSPREADEEESDGIERHDHADPDPSEESLQKTESAAQRNHTPGFQSTLSPLKEDDTASIESSQTQEEKKEIESREEQAIHEFYNAYRNPLARLRARCPEAPAEFLAVSRTPFDTIWRTDSSRRRSMSSLASRAIFIQSPIQQRKVTIRHKRGLGHSRSRPVSMSEVAFPELT
jgi:hypothetical protein